MKGPFRSIYYLFFCLLICLKANAQETSSQLEPIKLKINIQEDLSRKPIAKAICRVFEEDQVKAQYISDENGNVDIRIEPYKLVYLDVIADGYFQIQKPIDTRDLTNIKWATRVGMMKEGWYQFKGVLLDEAFENFVPGISMKLYDRDDKRTYLATSNERGIYFFTLVPGHNYDLHVDQKGYLKTRSTIIDCQDKESIKDGKSVFCTSGFALLDFKKDRDNEQKIIVGTTRLQKLELNKVYQVENIYYDYGKASIRKDAKPVLDNLYLMLKDNPNIRIELASHTDSRGKDEFNRALSQRRAESVVNFLIEKGIAKSRLVAKGYGETKILNRCKNGVDCSDKEHQANRRTAFKIVEFLDQEEEETASSAIPVEVEPTLPARSEPAEVEIEIEEAIPIKDSPKPREIPVVVEQPREIPPAIETKTDTSAIKPGTVKKGWKKEKATPWE